jgi:hypothetical protein
MPTARETARSLCEGFRAHDERDRERAIAAFRRVDDAQFDHLTTGQARDAAEAYVAALWAKDALEAAHTYAGDPGPVDETYSDRERRPGDATLDRDSLADSDWAPVREALARRADVVGMDAAYADHSTTFWRRHKCGGDYWTPAMRAQTIEIRAAMQDPGYPHKTGDGASGVGALPLRYSLGNELHDAHSRDAWERAVDVMTPYYARIFHAHD